MIENVNGTPLQPVGIAGPKLVSETTQTPSQQCELLALCDMRKSQTRHKTSAPNLYGSPFTS